MDDAEENEVEKEDEEEEEVEEREEEEEDRTEGKGEEVVLVRSLSLMKWEECWGGRGREGSWVTEVLRWGCGFD